MSPTNPSEPRTENAVGDEICVLCGTAMPAGTGATVAEGTACGACAAQRAATMKKKLMPLALYAIIAAFIPLAFSCATISETTASSGGHSVSTRILIYTSTESNEFSADTGKDPGPVVRKYSEPIAYVFGGCAALLGLAAAATAARASDRRSLAYGAGAAAIGAWKVAQGLGLI